MKTSAGSGQHSLLSRFLPILNKPWRKSSQDSDSRNPSWENMLDIEETINWNAEDYSTLEEHEYRKPLCQVRFLQSEARAQSVLLGFDLTGNQLLIDEVFPTIADKFFDETFEITFNTLGSLLVVGVKRIERVYANGQTALMVKVAYKRRAYDRRNNSRVRFTKEHSPKIDLLIPMSPVIRGQLSDLSSEGLKMTAFTAQKPDLARGEGKCTVRFNEHHTLSACIRVKQVQHLRSPTQHTILRLIFVQLSSEQIDQINSFLESFQALERQVPTNACWTMQRPESAIL